jgi:SAM-dependent methyltransferase
MSTERVSSSHVSPAPVAPPSYSGDLRTGLFVAEFGSGARVPVAASRARAYPGLPGTAPCTLPFYRAVETLSAEGLVLDAGCGSGAGARQLLELGREVVAVDIDVSALAFAREYAAGARVLETDLRQPLPIADAALAVVADTLAHTLDPDGLLRSVRASLQPGGTLMIAEAAAYPSQRLIAPARRAFTQRELGAALARAGFAVDGWLCTGGTFVACVARRIEDEAVDALANASLLAQRGRYNEARCLLESQRTERAVLALELVLARAELALAERAGDVAAEAFFKAQELDALDARALAGLSRIALSVGAGEDALRLARDAARAEPASALAVATLALVAEALEYPEAFSAWRVAVNLAPDDVGIVTGLGRAAAARGEYHYAVCAFDRARAYGDEFGPEFHVALGWLLLADGRRHDAALEARHAQALAPEDAAARELFEAASVREAD